MAKKIIKAPKNQVKVKWSAARLRHKIVLRKIAENVGKGISMGKAMQEVGYSKNYADSPDKIQRTRTWQEILESPEFGLTDENLAKVHNELLTAKRIDHLTFPPITKAKKKKKAQQDAGEVITDEMIEEILTSVGCTLRKIIHGEMARHVYFWAPDNLSRDKALDKAYKIKKRYDTTLTIKRQLADISDEELERQVAEIVSGTLGTIEGEEN